MLVIILPFTLLVLSFYLPACVTHNVSVSFAQCLFSNWWLCIKWIVSNTLTQNWLESKWECERKIKRLALHFIFIFFFSSSLAVNFVQMWTVATRFNKEKAVKKLVSIFKSVIIVKNKTISMRCVWMSEYPITI